MKDVLEMQLHENSSEERLPDFSSEFPYICSKAFLNRYNVFWHWHKAVELFYVESGALEYDTPRGRTVFPAGSGGIINSDVLHISRSHGSASPTIQLVHLFDASLLADQFGGRIMQKYISPIVAAPQIELIPLQPDVPAHESALKKLRASFEISENAFGYELRLRDALTEIWLELLRLTPPVEARASGASDKTKQMMIYIHEHYTEHISVADIAAAGFVSERECYRAFQSFLHTSPAEYIKSYRLQTACKLLSDGKESVTQIGLACGFGSGSFFGKVFRDHFGMPPSEYRREMLQKDG